MEAEYDLWRKSERIKTQVGHYTREIGGAYVRFPAGGQQMGDGSFKTGHLLIAPTGESVFRHDGLPFGDGRLSEKHEKGRIRRGIYGLLEA